MGFLKNTTTSQKVIVSVLAVVIFYFAFLGDYLQYRKVINDQNLYEIGQYYSDYPNGWFLEEVKVEEVKITRDILLVREFFVQFPESEYYDEIEDLRIELWNTEISNFNSLVLENYNYYEQGAVEFFKNLLVYMRDNRKSTINMSMKGEVNVIDFEQFPEDVQVLWDLMSEYERDISVTDNVLSLTKYYSKGNLSAYEFEIAESIESCFENILSKNFISVSDKSRDSGNELEIYIDYKVNNQMIKEEGFEQYPDIWTYTIGDKFNSYILGVEILFYFNFVIPGIDVYSYTQISEPDISIEGFDSLEEGYEMMTRQNFVDFASKVETKFGINK